MDLKRVADEAKNGVVETYYDNGQLYLRGFYKDGKPSPDARLSELGFK